VPNFKLAFVKDVEFIIVLHDPISQGKWVSLHLTITLSKLLTKFACSKVNGAREFKNSIISTLFKT
jgi:hypothetical protein